MIRRAELSNYNHVAVKKVTQNYTIDPGVDEVILVDATAGAVTITLPGAVGNANLHLTIKKIDSSANAVTITPALSAQTIDGATSVTISAQYSTLEIASDGAVWQNQSVDVSIAAPTLQPNSAITVANGGNTVGLTITQNDTTNNPDALVIVNNGTGKGIFLKGKNKSAGQAASTGGIAVFTTDAQSTDFGGVITLGGMQDTAATTLVGFASIAGRKENNTDGNTRGYLQLAQAGVEKFRIDSRANTVLGGVGSAVATTATDGFVYIPNCAGAPTGNPGTNYTYTGRSPMIFDTTNNKIWFYNSGWKGVVVA